MTNGSAPRRWLLLATLSLLVVAAVAVSAPWLVFVAKGDNPGAWGVLPFAASSFFLTLCGINALRERRGLPPAVTLGESFGCFIIILMGGWVATWSYVEVQMPLLTSPWVFASPENGWKENIIPYLPGWAMGPAGDPWASGFYNGLSSGHAIPWGMWLRPALAWSAFTVVWTAFMISLAGLMARQWIEHDRLTFPHAEVLVGAAKGFLKSRLFWYGVAITCAVPLWNLFQQFVPVFPQANLYFGGGPEGVEWYKGLPRIRTDLNLFLLGLLYFVHRDIVISMVVFFVLISFRDYGLNLAGFKLEHGDLYSSGDMGSLQLTGAFMSLILFSLWAGRHTIRAYLKAAWEGTGEDWSWLSPRATVAVFLASSAGLVVWLGLLGLRQPGGLLVLLGSQALGYIGSARILAESSFEVGWPTDQVDLTVIVCGTKRFAPAALAALALASCWVYGTASLGQVGNAMTAERTRTQGRFPRGTFTLVLVAVALATFLCMFATAWLAYRKGANTFGVWHYQWYMRMPFDRASEAVRTPLGTDWLRLTWLGVGMATMGVLIFLRNNVVGWFLHPVGFILAAMGRAPGAGCHMWVFTGIVAWIFKTLLLRLGGVESYEKWKPFFGGLVLGVFCQGALVLSVRAVWALVKGTALGAQ
ncbi:MAG: DUF6785 family protein [Candidatus Coatesbacteria bacterium]